MTRPSHSDGRAGVSEPRFDFSCSRFMHFPVLHRAASRARLSCLLGSSSLALSAQTPSTGATSIAPTQLNPYVVQGRATDLIGTASSASQGIVGAAELDARPSLRRGELLEVIPGVVITQHSGGGKANQYFLRGFNLDHGTDFSVTVDGMPVNLRTHAHGRKHGTWRIPTRSRRPRHVPCFRPRPC